MNDDGVHADVYTADEVAVIKAMRAAGGWPDVESLVRSSLWMMAHHLGVDVPRDVFPFKRTARFDGVDVRAESRVRK